MLLYVLSRFQIAITFANNFFFILKEGLGSRHYPLSELFKIKNRSQTPPTPLRPAPLMEYLYSLRFYAFIYYFIVCFVLHLIIIQI